MSKHTPAPWTVPHFARPDVNCECEYVLCDSQMGAVASVHCSGEGEDWAKHGDNPKFAEAVANAHLIAAAPDLLDALRRCVAILPRYETAGKSYGEDEELNAVLETVTDALAKAEPAP